MMDIESKLAQRDKEENPIRVALVGAGQMGAETAATIGQMKGMAVSVVVDQDEVRAQGGYAYSLKKAPIVAAQDLHQAQKALESGMRIAATDYRLATRLPRIDSFFDATASTEMGAVLSLDCFDHGMHLVMMNVECDVTIGPVLRRRAQKAGVVYSLAAGDEPAACKELYDLAVSMGFTVVAAGKGKNNPLDRHGTPADPAIQKEAARRGLSPNMLIEFIDGSKTMIEMAAVSNATGLVPDVRGMHGPTTDRDHLNQTFALKQDGGVLNKMGVVDYGIGRVAPGVFLIVRTDHPRLREAMILRDMGNGPYYTLFRPFHLCSIEVPLTCAMLGIRRKSNMQPLDRLVSEVFAVAKRDLRPGDTLDAIGGTTYYSLIDTYETAKAECLLPIGLAKGAKVLRPIKMDTPITCADVEIQPSTVYSLRQLQEQWFEGKLSEPELLKAVDALAND